jgi:hypothetical protein
MRLRPRAPLLATFSVPIVMFTPLMNVAAKSEFIVVNVTGRCVAEQSSVPP